MLSAAIQQFERVALRTNAERAVRLLGWLPQSAIETLQRGRFRRTLRLAAERSSFYREEFRRRGIDVRRIEHPSELGDFYTTGEDLCARDPEAFLMGRADTAFETTGTTSPVPKRVFFSAREIEETGRIAALWLNLLGMRSEDRVVSAFDCSFWISPAVLRAGLEYLKCFHVEAGKIDPAEFYERVGTYRPNIIFGEPSWMMRLSEVAKRRGTWPMKFLLAGGENITEDARHAIERVWNAPLYLNYGQTESFGALGAECRMKDGYHRNDLYFLYEIADADQDGYGELVFSTLTRDVMPLIRYRSSDITRLDDERCPCGVFAGRIGKIRARCDEMVVCGMGNIGPWVFEEMLRGIAGVRDDWQVAVRHEGQRDVVELRVEISTRTNQAEIERAVFARLRDRFSDFWKNYELRLYGLRVVAYQPGSLREGRKLQRIVDERHMLKSRARLRLPWAGTSGSTN